MTKRLLNGTSAITLAGLLAFCNLASGAENASTFTLTTGLDYSSGDYGDDVDTEITSVPVVAKYEADRWVLKLTVPYVTITGPGNVVPSIGQVGDTPRRRRTTESGLGDVTASATYNVFAGSASLPAIDITGKVKFATADEDKGLGTGENDYATQVDLYQGFGKFTALATIGYRVYGNPSFVNLDNVFYGSLGGAYRLAPKTSVGVIYDYRPKITPNGSPISEAVAFVTHTITDQWKAQAYVVSGFSDGSPDIGGGALISFVF